MLPATKVVFTTLPSGTAVAGFAFPMQPRVAVQNAMNQTMTDAGQTITLTPFSDALCTVAAAGTLQVLTNPIPPNAGVAAFDAVAYAGSGSVYLRASAPGLTSACSPQIAIAGTQFTLSTAISDTGTGNYGWASYGDVDNDGRPDLGLSTDATGPVLFLNRGTSAVTLRPWAPHERTIAFGDCDNDGLRDVLLTDSTAGPGLYRNLGDGGFSDLTLTSTVVSPNPEGAGWLDYNRDGLLDLLVPSGNTGSVGLWRNMGNCVFTDHTSTALLPTIGDNGEVAIGLDYDVDGDVDLFVGSAQGKDGGELTVYRNNGNATFAVGAMGLGPAAALDYKSGLAFGDYDNDGDFDLAIARNALHRPALYRNVGSGNFSDVSATTQDWFNGPAGDISGIAWGDLDNDGLLDLIAVVNGASDRVYRNLGGGRFALVGASTGLTGTQGDKDATGVALADADLDGDLDPYINNRGVSASRFFGNNSNAGSALKVRVLGKGAGFSPRDATGAIVFLFDASGSTLRAVREISGGGHMGQNDATVHFGLANSWGGASGTYVVRVRFNSGLYTRPMPVVPSASTVTINGLTLPNTIEIVEP